jgi:hypothetical protein
MLPLQSDVLPLHYKEFAVYTRCALSGLFLYDRTSNQPHHILPPILNIPFFPSLISIILQSCKKIGISTEGSRLNRPKASQLATIFRDPTTPSNQDTALQSRLAKKISSKHAFFSPPRFERGTPERLWILQSGVMNHFTMGRISVT